MITETKAQIRADAALCTRAEPSGFMIFRDNAASDPISIIRKKKGYARSAHIPRDDNAAKNLVRRWFETEEGFLDFSTSPVLCDRHTLVLKNFYRSAGIYMAIFFCGDTSDTCGEERLILSLPECLARESLLCVGSKKELYETAGAIAGYIGCRVADHPPIPAEQMIGPYATVDGNLFGAFMILIAVFCRRCCNRKIKLNISEKNGDPFVSVFCSGIRKNLMTHDGEELIPDALTELSECRTIAEINGVFFEEVKVGNRLTVHFIPARREASELGIKAKRIFTEDNEI